VIVSKLGSTEPLYEWLAEKLKGQVIFYTIDTLPPCRKLAEQLKEDPNDEGETLVVFDDLVNEGDPKCIKDYFIMGRKCGFTIWYLSQSFHAVSKLVRLQCTHLLLGKLGSTKDLDCVMRNYTLGVDKQQLLQMHREATREPLSFMFVDVHSTDENKKFGKNFGHFFHQEGGDEETV
jgi:hypothetical protein